MNKFVRYTIDNLINVDKNDKKLGSGFKINNIKEEDVILILGINPAGYEKEAEYCNANNLYLGYVGGATLPKVVGNNKYFGGIYRFASAITNNSCKFEWCNMDIDQIESKLSNLSPIQLKEVRKFHNEHKNNKYTIYLGDLFYYFTTTFSDFKKKIKPMTSAEKYDYAMKMLKLHVEELKKHNKNVKFIYINNAEATSYFQNNKIKTYDIIDDIPVFYGGMLTSQHAMDKTSTLRLVEEIKNKVKL